jgi:hypothetical protein
VIQAVSPTDSTLSPQKFRAEGFVFYLSTQIISANEQNLLDHCDSSFMRCIVFGLALYFCAKRLFSNGRNCAQSPRTAPLLAHLFILGFFYLLHPRDGLALQGVDTVGFEALSNDAILFLFEVSLEPYKA